MLDIGSGRYLVNDLSLLEDEVDCKHNCFIGASDGGLFVITKHVSVIIWVKTIGPTKTARLLNVSYTFNLGRKIISFGTLENTGCVFEYLKERRVSISYPDGAPIMDVDRIINVLPVKISLMILRWTIFVD